MLKSAGTAEKPLSKWAYARVHKHSVGAEGQVENQQVVTRLQMCNFKCRFVELKYKLCKVRALCISSQKGDLVLYSLAEDVVSKEPRWNWEVMLPHKM